MSGPRGTEREIRERLGVPSGAARVLVFAESSHWDPDWLMTSEEYYRLRVRRIFRSMIHWLEREPRRVFSIESVFFLRMYWERNAEDRDRLREWVNAGRIRLSGSGVNTPDTLLPPLEALLRDFLHGQEWLRGNGMYQEPRLAYLPDNFGNSPTLPTLLRAMGFRYTAFSRIDGILFPGSDYRPAGCYPLPGSSATLLLKDMRSVDFIWRDVNGEEVVCHLNPFTYGQGNTLVHGGWARWMGLKVGVPSLSFDFSLAFRRISRFARQLEPLSPTPYMFCPIGLDFNDPLPHLVSLLDGYNRTIFPRTGVFAVNASLEDYLDLVSAHRSRLPLVGLDPNPYFMGFYLSRPEAKQLWNSVVRCLVTAEKLLVERELKACGDRNEALWSRLRNLWDEALMANHHDFVTGTSPARVWEREQKPLLLRWRRESCDLLEEILAGNPGVEATAVAELRPGVFIRSTGGKSTTPKMGRERLQPTWKREGERLLVETSRYRLEVDGRRGGCISQLTDLERGVELFNGPANDVVSYRDSGGLWRMGHEFFGGSFRETARSSDGEAEVRVREEEGSVQIEVISDLEGMRLVRRIWCREASPILMMRVEGRLADHRTASIRFPLAGKMERILMEVSGGLVHRPTDKLYRPTFWASGRLVIPEDASGNWDVAFLPGVPSCVSLVRNRGLELGAMRNAPRERAFGILPLLSFPARGADRGLQSLDYAVLLRPPDGEEDPLRACLRAVLEDDALSWPAGWKTGPAGLALLAAKKPLRGDGHILRVYSPLSSFREAVIFREDAEITEAYLCDARERDVERLTVSGGRVSLSMSSPIATIRVFTERKQGPVKNRWSNL